jgi:hypothetical protein
MKKAPKSKLPRRVLRCFKVLSKDFHMVKILFQISGFHQFPAEAADAISFNMAMAASAKARTG